jgi:hypothetical protein
MHTGVPPMADAHPEIICRRHPEMGHPPPPRPLNAAYPLSPVYQADELAPGLLPIPGLAHLTLAGAVPHGLRRAELLMQTLAPGVATPIHRHDCEEIFLVLRGEGTSRIRDQVTPSWFVDPLPLPLLPPPPREPPALSGAQAQSSRAQAGNGRL